MSALLITMILNASLSMYSIMESLQIPHIIVQTKSRPNELGDDIYETWKFNQTNVR